MEMKIKELKRNGVKERDFTLALILWEVSRIKYYKVFERNNTLVPIEIKTADMKGNSSRSRLLKRLYIDGHRYVYEVAHASFSVGRTRARGFGHNGKVITVLSIELDELGDYTNWS